MIDFTIDIETIPDQRIGACEKFIANELENFCAPSTMSKGEACEALELTAAEIKDHTKESAIAAWAVKFGKEHAEKTGMDKWLKTSLDGNCGQIAVIGWKIESEPSQSIFRQSSEPADEIEMLKRFAECMNIQLRAKSGNLQDVKFIGHNVESFDLPFFFKRSVVAGIAPKFDCNPNRYSDRIYDTMTKWAGFNNRIKLDDLCKILDIPSPKQNGIDGSKVWEYIKAGKIEEVAKYCRDDVEQTYAIYRKMTFQNSIDFDKITVKTKSNTNANWWEK